MTSDVGEKKFAIDFSIRKIVLHNIQPSPCPLRRPQQETTVVDFPTPLRRLKAGAGPGVEGLASTAVAHDDEPKFKQRNRLVDVHNPIQTSRRSDALTTPSSSQKSFPNVSDSSTNRGSASLPCSAVAIDNILKADCYYEETLERHLECSGTADATAAAAGQRSGENDAANLTDLSSLFNTPYRKANIRRGYVRALSPSLLTNANYLSGSNQRGGNPIYAPEEEGEGGGSVESRSLIRTGDYIIGSASAASFSAANRRDEESAHHYDVFANDRTDRMWLDDVIDMANISSKYRLTSVEARASAAATTAAIDGRGDLVISNATYELATTDETPEELFENALERLGSDEGTDEGFWTFDRNSSRQSGSGIGGGGGGGGGGQKLALNLGLFARDSEPPSLSHLSSPREQWREDYTLQLAGGTMYISESLTSSFNTRNDATLLKLADSLRRLSLPIYNHFESDLESRKRTSVIFQPRPSSENFHLSLTIPATPSLSAPSTPAKLPTNQSADDRTILLSEETVTQEIVLRISRKDRTRRTKRSTKDPHKDVRFKRIVRMDSEDDAASPLPAVEFSHRSEPRTDRVEREHELPAGGVADEASLHPSPLSDLCPASIVGARQHRNVTTGEDYRIAGLRDIMRTINEAVRTESTAGKDRTGIKISCEVTQIKSPATVGEVGGSEMFSERTKNLFTIDI